MKKDKQLFKKVLRKKLWSMRYSEKEMKKEKSRHAREFMYGYTECINDLLEYLQAGGDGMPEHKLPHLTN